MSDQETRQMLVARLTAAVAAAVTANQTAFLQTVEAAATNRDAIALAVGALAGYPVRDTPKVGDLYGMDRDLLNHIIFQKLSDLGPTARALGYTWHW